MGEGIKRIAFVAMLSGFLFPFLGFPVFGVIVIFGGLLSLVAASEITKFFHAGHSSL